MKVLVADDDPQLRRALRITLAARGYEVVEAADGKQAIDRIAATHPDLVLLDLGMPAVDGMDVVRAVRGWSPVPIIVLSGRTDSAEKVEVLDAGADDYVTKPFAMDELLARLRARTRVPPGAGDVSAVSFGFARVDLVARTVVRDGDLGAVPVRLTPTEWRMLEVFLRNPGRLLTREMLLTQVWGPHATDAGYLRLYVAQLRRKLEPVPAMPRHFITEAGMGYRFEP